MSDPVETSQPEIIARILGALTLVLGAIAALWRTVFGSKAERADALERAAEIALRNAEHADERAEHAERDAARAEADTKSVRVERDDCTARLAAHEERSARERAEDRARIAALEAGLAEHANCGPRIAFLTAENEWIGRGLLAVAAGEPLPERPDTLTPPANPHLPSDDDGRPHR